MENTTSFDLNLAIQNWRENLAQSPAFRSENLDELESHLRDSIATLQTRELSAEESFAVAAKRIGKGGALESEFGKMNEMAIWQDRLFWMLIGNQVWFFVSGAIGLVTRNALFFGLKGVGYDFKSAIHIVPATLSIFLQLAGFAGSLALCWWLFCRKGRRVGGWLGRRLHRRAAWARTFGALYLLSLSLTLIIAGVPALLAHYFDLDKIREYYLLQSFSSITTVFVTPVVFIGLTLFLARKRLRLIKA
jgi:hypothetical protein